MRSDFSRLSKERQDVDDAAANMLLGCVEALQGKPENRHQLSPQRQLGLFPLLKQALTHGMTECELPPLCNTCLG